MEHIFTSLKSQSTYKSISSQVFLMKNGDSGGRCDYIPLVSGPLK